MEFSPPEWWTAELPFALRNKKNDVAALYPSEDAAIWGMIAGDRAVTVDSETGTEIPVRRHHATHIR